MSFSVLFDLLHIAHLTMHTWSNAQREAGCCYLFRWWKKDEPAPSAEDFHAATVREINEWNACVKDKGQAKCVRLYNPQQV